MTATLEQIEMLRARANVSYQEAKEALEQCNCDLVEALIYLEKQNKVHQTKTEDKANGFGATLKKIFRTCNETALIISKNERNILDLPMTVVIIATIIVPPLVIIALLVALFTGHRIRLERPGSDIKFNKTLDDISAAANKMGEQVSDVINKN